MLKAEFLLALHQSMSYIANSSGHPQDMFWYKNRGMIFWPHPLSGTKCALTCCEMDRKFKPCFVFCFLFGKKKVTELILTWKLIILYKFNSFILKQWRKKMTIKYKQYKHQQIYTAHTNLSSIHKRFTFFLYAFVIVNILSNTVISKLKAQILAYFPDSDKCYLHPSLHTDTN